MQRSDHRNRSMIGCHVRRKQHSASAGNGMIFLICAFFCVGMVLAKKDLLSLAADAEDRGDEQAAFRYYSQAWEQKVPFDLASHVNFGGMLAQMGRVEDGLEQMKLAKKLPNPNPKVLSQICTNMGRLYQRINRHDLAGREFEAAIAADKLNPQAYMAAAWSYNTLGDLPRAAGFLQEARRLDPKNPQILYAAGEVLNNLMRWDEAIDVYRAAIKINPNDPSLHSALGQSLLNVEKHAAAAKAFQRAVKLNPKHGEAVSGLWISKISSADWKDLDSLYSQMKEIVVSTSLNTNSNSKPSPLSPYHSLFTPLDPKSRRILANSWSARLGRDARAAAKWTGASVAISEPILRLETPRRLRIAYVSRRIMDYAGTRLMMGVYRAHDRSKTEIWCYATGPDDFKETRRQVEVFVDHFHDVSLLSPQEIAKAVNKVKIDVVIDYDGLHSHNNIAFLSLRSAPIQLTWLGFAGTVGQSYVVEHIIVDRIVAPPDFSKDFAEKLVYLPRVYQPRDLNQKISEKEVTRESQGLPTDAPVFVSFNRVEKLDPSTFALWLRILNETGPDSVLWMLSGADETSNNLRKSAEGFGISKDRLVFAGKVSNDVHLKRHSLADVCLDTKYYNAHTTASDSLVMGVPFLTLPDEAFSARVGASLLSSIGFPELIANDQDSYVALAKRLVSGYRNKDSNNNHILDNYRKRLGDGRQAFDSKTFTRGLERALFAAVDCRESMADDSETKLMMDGKTGFSAKYHIRAV